MRFERAVWASLLLVTLATPALAQNYWIDAPDSVTHRDYAKTSDYIEPVCPPRTAPSFFGVVIIDGLSRPIYTCEPYGPTASEVAWETLE